MFFLVIEFKGLKFWCDAPARYAHFNAYVSVNGFDGTLETCRMKTKTSTNTQWLTYILSLNQMICFFTCHRGVGLIM